VRINDALKVLGEGALDGNDPVALGVGESVGLSLAAPSGRAGLRIYIGTGSLYWRQVIHQKQ